MLTTLIFPAWRAHFANLHRHSRQLAQQSLLQLDQLFGPWLPPGLLSQADEGPNSRQRIYSVRCTFFGFLFQVLKPQCPCREVVRQIQATCALQTEDSSSPGNSAYCQARLRLPWDILPRLRVALAARADGLHQLWRGLQIKVVDGTGVSLPDTPKNQRSYPQPGGQKPGCGFPLLKIVGVFSLATGALLDYAKGNKHQHELGLLYRLLDTFKASDLVLADRGFSTYTLMALLWQRKVHTLFRLHHARPGDFRKGKRLGKDDRLLLWPKPDGWQKPSYMSKQLWKALPKQLAVRMVRFTLQMPGYRTKSVTLITTLLDAELYPAEELAKLYARRWCIELWLRDIKTSMHMETLSCLSPKMVHKELEMFLIAYNLIRCLMTQAAQIYRVPISRLSFKGTVDSVRQFSAALTRARSRKQQDRLLDRLLELIALDKVPERPGRREPRAVKRRPKPYQKLTCHRHLMKEMLHRSKYRKIAA